MEENFKMPINSNVLERLQASDPTLTQLDLSYQELTYDDLQNLVDLLEKNPQLKTLEISGNPLGSKAGELLAKTPYLESLTAINCELRDAGANAFGQNTTLKSLVLSDNCITLDGDNALTHNKTLTYLDLTGNQIGDAGAIALAKHPAITTLILCRNRIGTNGALALSLNEILITLNISYNPIQITGIAAFASNIHLRTLSIAGCNAGTEGIKQLAKNTTLTSLDASYNRIDDAGIIELAAHPALIALDISYNQVGFAGANALGGLNKILLTLIASYNQFCDKGAIAIARHPQLTHLDLTGNAIEFEGTFALSLNVKIETLILSYNTVCSEGALVLSKSKNLKNLFLSYNEIGDIGALAFKGSSTLRSLNLNYNQISNKRRIELLDSFKNTNCTLTISFEQPEFTFDNLNILFRISDIFSCISSYKGVIQYFNPAFPRVLGYTSDELLGESFLKFIHPEDKEAFEQSLANKNGNNEEKGESAIAEIKQFKHRFRCKNGSYRLINWSSQDKGNRIYLSGADITEKTQLESELREAGERNLRLLLDEANIYNRKQAKFITMLSHELRNPVFAILGSAEFLQVKIDALEKLQSILTNQEAQKELGKIIDSMKNDVAQIIHCVDYQSDILNNFLEGARIMEGKLITKTDLFNLSQVIQDSINMLQTKAIQKGLLINSKLPKEILLKGDSNRVKQILINIIDNAIKFTQQGHIDINLEMHVTSENSVLIQIHVIDTGIGLTPVELKKLFKLFSQTVGKEYGGSGLGLYLMKELAMQMGGDVWAISEKEKGSTFTISLPFKQLTNEELEQFHHEAAMKKTSTPSPSPKISIDGHQVLVVEDNHINSQIIGRHLVKAGYVCRFAFTGEEALQAFDEQVFDIILMDINMPGMGGLAATCEIRHRETQRNLPPTPIVAITANDQEHEITAAMTAGVTAYAVKPVKQATLLSILNKHLKNKPLAAQVTPNMLTPLDEEEPIIRQSSAAAASSASQGHQWFNLMARERERRSTSAPSHMSVIPEEEAGETTPKFP